MTEWLFDPVRHRVAPGDVVEVIVNGESVARYAVRMTESHDVQVERIYVPLATAPAASDEVSQSQK